MKDSIITKIKRFKRFTHKKFAIFASLHSEVTIGHVSSYITNQQLSKSNSTPFEINHSTQLENTSTYEFSEVDEEFDLYTLLIDTLLSTQNPLFATTTHSKNSLLYNGLLPSTR